MLEGYVDKQKDVNRLQKKADRNLMKCNKKCKILNWGRGRGIISGGKPYFVGQRSKKEICTKDLWEVDNKLNGSQHSSLAIKKAHDI